MNATGVPSGERTPVRVEVVNNSSPGGRFISRRTTGRATPAGGARLDAAHTTNNAGTRAATNAHGSARLHLAAAGAAARTTPAATHAAGSSSRSRRASAI